jgi:hypothetical protein
VKSSFSLIVIVAVSTSTITQEMNFSSLFHRSPTQSPKSVIIRHGQVKGYFNREYIKKSLFAVESGKLYNMVFEYRQKFDYVDLVTPDVTAIDEYLRDATAFVQQIRAHLFPNPM